MPTPTNFPIKTQRLLIRRLTVDDLPVFAGMNADPEVMRHFPAPLTPVQSLASYERIATHHDRHGFSVYAVCLKDTREFLGFTGFMIPQFENHFTPCVEIGWRFRKEFWHKGYATEAASACLQFARNGLTLREIVSFTSMYNSPSERVMQRIGMVFQETFPHPGLHADHRLSTHVLYKIRLD